MKNLLRETRLSKGLKTREIAQKLGVDQALVSKFENGQRLPTRKQIQDLISILSLNEAETMSLWLKEKVMQEIGGDYAYIPQIVSLVAEDYARYYINPKIEISADLNAILNKIDAYKAELDAKRVSDSFRIAQALETEYTFESNRIEGNTLTLRETDLVINEGLTIAGKSMREHLEALNHHEAIVYVKELAQNRTQINEREILTIHNLILRGIYPEDAGKYRKVQVMISGSQHQPPSPFRVKEEMEQFMSWFSSHKLSLHPVLLAAEVHERLVTIHPFVDGNGRTSRLMMNLILLQNGYVIANLKGDNASRMSYYKALEDAQTKQSKVAFYLLVSQTELDCLQRYIQILG